MNRLDLANLHRVIKRYKAEKAAWGMLSSKSFSDVGNLKAKRQELNKRMRKSEGEIVKISVHGCECINCGSRDTMKQVTEKGFRTCCPDRIIGIRGSRK